MATGITQHSKCTLCLSIFQKPKIIPCFHTYCEECLKQLALRHGGKQFPCPICRKNAKVPPGGVSNFQTNFYIDTEHVKKYACKGHPNNVVVSFCISCDQAICVECMLGSHKPHDVQTIAEKAKTSMAQLAEDKVRLQSFLETIRGCERKTQQNQKFLKTQKEEMKKEIKLRCSELVSFAEKHRDAQLESLDKLAKELDSSKKDSEIITTMKENCTKVTGVLKEVQDTLDKGEDLQVVTLAKEMKTGRSSPEALQALLAEGWPQEMFDIPALPTEYLQTDISRLVSSAIGSVTTRRVVQSRSDLYLFEVVRCQARDVYFFAVHDNGDICVSYKQDGTPVRRFNKHGLLMDQTEEITGRVTMQCLPNGECFYIDTDPTHKHVLCAKSRHPFVLVFHSPALATVKKLDMGSSGMQQTGISEWKPMFTFNCRSFVAFDVNDSESLFAVLEKAHAEGACTLKIFQKTSVDAVRSFLWKSFQPSDICFYNNEGEEALLVADMTQSRILAIYYVQGKFVCKSFIQSQWLSQPVALNTDTQGHLWIGCSDGRIFMCDHFS